MSRKSAASVGHTFAAPLAIALASAIGLVAALVGDGVNDWVSWIGLAVPVASIVRAWLRRGA